nr:lipase family protein [Treponema sp.]
MKPWELYEEIKKTEYTKSGDSVDWAVKVYPEEKLIRLLFEESTEDRDWRNNFDFPIKPYKQQDNTLWFARGWGNAYKSCNDEIMEKLTKTFYELKDQNYTVEVCGWSYGGAMALLAAEDFCYRTGYLP